MSILSEPNLYLTADGNFECHDDPGERGYARNPRRRSVTPQEADILTALAANRRVLEIGTGLGVSTRALAKYAKQVVSVDIDPWCHQFEFPDNVRLTNEVPKERFDLAFIDGNHAYESVVRDIGRVNAPLIVLHDHYLAGVAKAVRDSGLDIIEAYDTRCEMVLCSPSQI